MTHEKTCILILGMHRSGTSALTRALNIMGCALSPELIEGRERDNPRGFWESRRVVDVNKRILEEVGSYWNDWTPFPFPEEGSDARAALVAQVKAALEADFADADLFVIKDPRICRLLPLWREALDEFGVRTVAVLPLRNPLEVAGSIQARNGNLAAESHLSWLRHVLDAERGSRDLPRVVTSYEDLLSEPLAVIDHIGERLELAWPRSPEEASVEIASFVSAGDRHQIAADGAPPAPDWVKEVYEVLLRWTGDEPSDEDLNKLTEIGAAFDRATPCFTQLVIDAKGLLAANGEAKREFGKLERKYQRDSGKYRETIARWKSELGETRRELRALTERHVAIKTRLEIGTGEIAGLTKYLLDAEKAAAAANRALISLLPGRGLLGGGARRRYAQALKSSGFLDEAWYRKRNKDVAKSGGDAAMHYVTHGAAEGRAPNAAMAAIGKSGS